MLSAVIRCLLSCKDTNFKANHNGTYYALRQSCGVCYLAKIRILKQITTQKCLVPEEHGCLLSCKDTNFKANHNTNYCFEISLNGVCYLAKIRILKQITTVEVNHLTATEVFVILQRYEF